MKDAAAPTPAIALYIEVAEKAAEGRGTDVARSIISHVLCRRLDKRAPLTCEILTGILKNNSLPSPAQQANNFITLLGGRLSSPGDLFDVSTHLRPNESHETIYSLIGIKTGSAESKDFRFIISALVEQGVLNADERDVISSDDLKIPSRISLTMGGWQKYEELQRSVKNSRKAFVAMEFPKEGSDQNCFFQETLFDKYLVPAVDLEYTSTDMSGRILVFETAALLTSTSSRPNSSRTRSEAAAIEAGSVTSSWSAWASGPTSWAAASPRSRLREPTRTVKFFAASSFAIWRPIP
jgi:hypothetical protein